jgi:hypothetical protein
MVLSALAALVIAGPAALASDGAPVASAGDPAAALAERANATLGLSASTVVSLDLPAAVHRLRAVEITLSGGDATVDLHPHSVRAPDFRLHEAQPDGSLREIPAAAPRTFRGTVRGTPDSEVAASLFGPGLRASIRVGAERWWVEPLAGRVDGAEAGHHVVYRADAVTTAPPPCGNTFSPEEMPAVPDGFLESGGESGLTCTARLACEADYYFWLTWGINVLDRIEFIVNVMNLQYEQQVGISHALGDVVVHTSLDPYPPPGAGLRAIDLLCLFSVFWTNFRFDIDRDVAQMFTGRPLVGSFVGYSTPATVCQRFGCVTAPCTCAAPEGIGGGFSVARSDWSLTDVGAVSLSAHEIGHNWGAFHCDVYGCCPLFTMCSSIGQNGVFSPVARYAMFLFKSGVPCLSCDTSCPRVASADAVLADDRVAGDQAGRAVAEAGDVNADGVNDFIVGAPYADGRRGKVYVYSGLDESLLFTFEGENANDRFGWSVGTAGDVDDDGHDDVIVGAPWWSGQRGRTYVYSGADGSRLHRKNGKSGEKDRSGYAVSGGVDVDDDGHDDFLVGEPHNDDEGNKAGRVRVYSGADGSSLGTVRGEAAGDRFGWAVAGLGRTNGDSHDDFAVGAPRNDETASNAGKVYVFSGRTLNERYGIPGLNKKDQFGHAIARAGDLNFDRRDDFVVGTPYYDAGDRTDAGRVDVFSGRNGLHIWKKTGQGGGDRMGWSVSAGRDADGDTLNDVTVGAPRHDGFGSNAGRVYVRSGWNGCLLNRIDGFEGDQFGYAVAMIDGGIGPASSVIGGAPRHDDEDDEPDVGTAVRMFFSMPAALEGAAAPAAPPAPDADLDGDGDVSGRDLVVLLSRWGACDPCPEDLTRDGRVDGADVIALLADW